MPPLKIEKVPPFSFSREGLVFIESNKVNLLNAGLWEFIHEKLPEIDPQLVAEYVKKFVLWSLGGVYDSREID